MLHNRNFIVGQGAYHKTAFSETGEVNDGAAKNKEIKTKNGNKKRAGA